MTGKFIIYGFQDPRPHKLDQLGYIGKSETGLQRCSEHLKPSSLANDTRKDRWIKCILAQGLKPIPIVIEEHTSKDDLFEAEKFWIAYFKGLGCDLSNSTDGGEGTTGYKHTEDTIQKLKESALSRDKTPYQNPHNKKSNIEINNEIFRNCCRCKTNKKIDQFTFDRGNNKYQGYCRDCNVSYKQEWKEINPSPTLSDVDYNASRLPGAHAGGEASKRPERREQARQQRSKAIQGTHIETGEIITFPSALKAKEAGFQNSNIGQAIKYNKSYKGYSWKFL